tara:strand:+ start:612 stop:1055 length:444 start_codon:yes stop_codon:yes gene_type:complete
MNALTLTPEQRQVHIKSILNKMNVLTLIPNQNKFVQDLASVPTGNIKTILTQINGLQLNSKPAVQQNANIETILKQVNKLSTTQQKLNDQSKDKLLQRKQEVMNLYNRHIKDKPQLVASVNKQIHNSESIPSNQYGNSFKNVMNHIK